MHADVSKHIGQALWGAAHPALWDCAPLPFMHGLTQEPDVCTGHARLLHASFPGCKVCCIPVGKKSDFETVQKFSVAQKLLSAPAAQSWFSCPSSSLSLQHKSLLYCHKARPGFISIIHYFTSTKWLLWKSIMINSSGMWWPEPDQRHYGSRAVNKRFQLVYMCQECWRPWGPMWRTRDTQQCPDSIQHVGITMERDCGLVFF